jgi:hypothetical protein
MHLEFRCPNKPKASVADIVEIDELDDEPYVSAAAMFWGNEYYTPMRQIPGGPDADAFHARVYGSPDINLEEFCFGDEDPELVCRQIDADMAKLLSPERKPPKEHLN